MTLGSFRKEINSQNMAKTELDDGDGGESLSKRSITGTTNLFTRETVIPETLQYN